MKYIKENSEAWNNLGVIILLPGSKYISVYEQVDIYVAIDTRILLLIYICIIYRLVIVIEIVDVLLTWP